MIRFYPFILLFLFSCSKKDKENIVLNHGDKMYEKAELFYPKNKDSAFLYFNRAYDFYASEKDSLNCANSLIYQSIVQNEEGDYFGAEETNVNALKFLKNKNHINRLSVYNTIAISRNNLKDYKTALVWYEKALKISKDSLEKIKIQNNIAVAYSKLRDYNKSIKIFKELFNSYIVNQDQNIKSKLLDNFAFTKFLQNKNYNAEPELYKALKIREVTKDFWGQNASHAHLSDYFEEKNLEKSLFHAYKMYEIAKDLKSPDDQIEALQKLVNLENASNSKKYFNIFLKLNDSLQTARNKAKNQFALERYGAEKNRADLLKSKAENTEKDYKILQRNIILGLSFLAIIFGLYWFNRRQKLAQKEKELLQQEKELEVKNTELKYSKKIHDVVSNGVYQLMSEIENTQDINKDKILNKLENIYEKSRDISYESAAENPNVDYKIQISNLINSFKTEVLKPVIIGNEENLWKEVSPKVKQEFLVVLQELLVNMKKHSGAKKVKLEFEKVDNQLNIIYTDDGIGFGENFQKKNGLRNAETRIFSFNGTLNFDQTTEKGIKIKISFPLKKT